MPLGQKLKVIFKLESLIQLPNKCFMNRHKQSENVRVSGMAIAAYILLYANTILNTLHIITNPYELYSSIPIT